MASGRMAPSNAKSGCNVDPTLHPDSRLAFRRQVHQTHGTHGTQGIIFADVVLIRCSEMRVDTPNPLWAWCAFSVQPRHQSMLIAAGFRAAADICATIISLNISDARHLRVGSYGFQLQSPT